MSGSRSNSINSFEESLNSTERRTSHSGTTPIVSPTVPEEKPLF